jgi:hypothetical protein
MLQGCGLQSPCRVSQAGEHLQQRNPQDAQEDRAMSTVGIFAGRGDVLVAMAFAILIGFYFGYKWRGLITWFTNRKFKKEMTNV